MKFGQFAALCVLPSLATAASITLTPVADTAVFHRDGTFGYNSTNYGTAEQLDTSQFGAGIWAMSYIRFDMSAIPAGATIDTASISLMRQSTTNIAGFSVVRNDTITTGRFGSYGLLDVAGNTSQTWSETALTGNLLGSERVTGTNPQFDTTTRTIDFNTDTETVVGGGVFTAGGSTVSVAGSNLLGFLQGRLNATSNSGLATIIIDYMEDSAGGGRGYSFASKENTGGLAVPTLTINYTAVPETSVAILGGLGLLGLLRRRRA